MKTVYECIVHRLLFWQEAFCGRRNLLYVIKSPFDRVGVRIFRHHRGGYSYCPIYIFHIHLQLKSNQQTDAI
jgi:hypothetical protein